MAAHWISILNWSVKPDNSGTVYFEPAAVNFGSNDRYGHMVLAFTSQSLRQGIGGSFVVPYNYAGTPKIQPMWATTATTGDVVWDFDYTFVDGDGTDSLDPSADTETVTVTDTAPGTARQLAQPTVALTGSNLANQGIVLFNFYRDGVNASDTLAASAWVFDLIFSYSDV